MIVRIDMRNITWSSENVHVIPSPEEILATRGSGRPFTGTFQLEEDNRTTEWHLIPAYYTWDMRWELSRDLIVEVQSSKQESVALTRLTMKEYGVGSNFSDAVYDLLTSLSGYREVLEAREDRLAESAAEELKVLRGLVRRKDSE